ncbi:hypothetical protein C2845_PM07G21280 [Panicum miliaceum]|uniref:Uncharacterized protein n=1 Tax=Panicum miliaceum TaxID=4540 RepID=A0A3L6SIQ7_PANMI|nr:hypothetical protein C2845_PM07G21280 [Panicum miliaceum]
MPPHTILPQQPSERARCVARAASTGECSPSTAAWSTRRASSARAAVQVDGAAAANGGFVRAPRKPTNHSKPAVGRAYKALVGKGEAGSGRGRGKFKHDEVKMYYLEVQGAEDAAVDAMMELCC